MVCDASFMMYADPIYVILAYLHGAISLYYIVGRVNRKMGRRLDIA